METICFESAYAPLEAVRGAGRWGAARLGSYARWSLDMEDPLELGTARVVALRLLTRGMLTPASAELDVALAAAFGPRRAAALRAAHRVQLALVCAGGAPDTVDTDLAAGGLFSPEEAAALARLAARDLRALLVRLERLYPGSEADDGPLFVSFHGGGRRGRRGATVADGWPDGALAHVPAARPGSLGEVREEDLRYFLRLLFRRERFRPGQTEAVNTLLRGEDAAVLLPTGSGKSLIYQLAGLLRPGTALIVEPLLSLIDDQLRHLSELGITAAALTSATPGDAALTELRAGRRALFYVAPERLDVPSFREAVRDLAEGAGVSLVAIDEAHCATQWGHDFRPAYRDLGSRARAWCAGPGGSPPLAALSGTASRAALERAAAELGVRAPVLAPVSLARPELEFRVELSSRPERMERLRGLAAERRFDAGLVFCTRVDGPIGAAEVAEELVWAEGLETGCFTGRAPAGSEPEAWERRKRAQAARFLSGTLPWLVCTSAFSLGIHKPDVRRTIHLGLPLSLEAFYQEAGRAGRDGRPAECWLLAHVRSLRRARRWLSGRLAVEPLRRELARLGPAERDDVSRGLGLHLSSYPGRRAEKESLTQVLGALGPLDLPRRVRLELPGQSGEAVGRCLARLGRAGVLDTAGRDICLAGGFTREAAVAAADIELDAVYDGIEPERRRSLLELLELCAGDDPGAALSRRLASY